MRSVSFLLVVMSVCTASARGPVEVTYTNPTLKMLALYDSTDGDHGGSVVLKRRVEPVLGRLGLSVMLHDVNEGLPTSEQMAGYRGVVTAFDDARMREAERYVIWLAEQLDAGRKVVVLNNFGAYQDATSEAWVEWTHLNRVFRSLGVAYDSQWTDDPALLRVVQQDTALFQPDTLDRIVQAAHYYRFRAIADDVNPALTIERTDIEEGQSLVVFTSPRGGMALSRYYESATGKQLLRLQLFLEKALFPASQKSRRILVVLDPESSSGHRMVSNLHWIIRYARLQVDFMRFRDLPRLRQRDLRRYGALVLASTNSLLRGGQGATEIERWVREDGGGFVSLFPNRMQAWDRMMGITRWTERAEAVEAIRYDRAFFPGMEGLFVRGDSYSAEVNPVQLSADTTVFASSAKTEDEDWRGTPILWSRRHGQGRVLVRNDTALTQKQWRGSTLQMILQSMPVAAVPIVNAGVYFIDDCPQPMWNTSKEPIQSEFGLTDTDFYRDVFWPDLMDMARDFALKFTFVLIFSYDDENRSGFSAEPFYMDAGKGVPLWMAREAVRLGHEVGLHGYNHQSLVTDSGPTSVGWPSRAAMTEGLLEARAEWEKLFGEGHAPFTYIAPNNHIHRAGKEAVHQAFPEIRVMSAQYLTENDIEGQEFDVDPDVGYFMDLPRVSSEFYTGSHNNVGMLDGVMLLGVWTHFVHPDDVYDPERNNGMGWAGLKEASRQMLHHMTTSYPWMRSLTARDAYHELVRQRTSPFLYELGDNEVEIHLGGGSTQPSQVLLRLDPGSTVRNVVNGRVLHAYRDLGYYYLETTGSPATVAFLPPAGPND